jgi:hypothetical protein
MVTFGANHVISVTKCEIFSLFRTNSKRDYSVSSHYDVTLPTTSDYKQLIVRTGISIVLTSTNIARISWNFFIGLFPFIFSSPELKAQVSYSDHLLSVVRLSVCPSVCL